MTNDYGSGNIEAQTIYNYDEFDRMDSVADPIGRVTEYEFDRNDRQIFVVSPDPDGDGPLQPPVQYFGYDVFGNARWQVDAIGNPTLSEFDEEDRLVVTSTADGARTEFTYYADGQAKEVIDPLGRRTLREYDELGRLWKTTLPTPDTTDDPLTLMSNAGVNHGTVIEYDAAGNVQYVTNTENQTTEIVYDGRNRRSKEIGAQLDSGLRPVTGFTYYPDGRIHTVRTLVKAVSDVATLDPGTWESVPGLEFEEVSYTYDKLGRPFSTTMTDPSDSTQISSGELWYDEFGREVLSLDSLGNRTRFAYDNLDRRTKVVNEHPDYDPIANPISLETEVGKPVTTYIYDDAGQPKFMLQKSAEGAIETTSYRYDQLGRLTWQISPDPGTGLGVSETAVLPAALSADVPYMAYSYDALGNVRSQTNAQNETTATEYAFVAGRYLPSQSVNANGDTVTYAYDAVGQRISLTDPPTESQPLGNTTIWEYDDHGRVSRELSPTGIYRQFEYDTLGNLIEKRDRRGWHTIYQRDALNRIDEEQWKFSSTGNTVRTIDFDYDLAGRMTDVNDPDHTYAYEFDGLGRLDMLTQNVGLTRDVEFDFDYYADGRRQSLAAAIGTASDFSNSYRYDALRRLNAFEQTGANVNAKVVDFNYDLSSRLDRVYRFEDVSRTDAVAVSGYGYDSMGRLTSLSHTAGDNPSMPSKIADYTWSYYSDNLVERFWSQNDDTNIDYEYDATGQLTSADADNAASAFIHDESYEYDAAGNRIETTIQSGVGIPYVSYWAVSQNDLNDATENNLEGQSFGGATYDSTTVAPIGLNDQSIKLDGVDDYLETVTSPFYDFDAGEFSLAFWVKPDSTDLRTMTLVSQGNPTAVDGIGFQIDYLNNWYSAPLRLYVNDGASYSQLLSINTFDMLRDDEWHHIAISVDNDRLVLFVDGLALRAADNLQSNAYNSQDVITFGKGGASPQYFNGHVDDVRVYNTVIDAQDVNYAFRGLRYDEITTYSTGQANRLLMDGTYSYVYDAEGNMKRRNHLDGGGFEDFTWDHRNRLINYDKFGPRESIQFTFESDDNDIIVDEIGNAFDGQLIEDASSVPVSDTTNFSQRALHLDGNGDFASLGIQEAIPTGESDFTMAAWFKPEATTNYMAIVAAGNTWGLAAIICTMMEPSDPKNSFLNSMMARAACRRFLIPLDSRLTGSGIMLRFDTKLEATSTCSWMVAKLPRLRLIRISGLPN